LKLNPRKVIYFSRLSEDRSELLFRKKNTLNSLRDVRSKECLKYETLKIVSCIL